MKNGDYSKLLQQLPEVRESIVTPISDDILQHIPHYRISLNPGKIDYRSFEKRLRKLISRNLGDSALPGQIDYTTEPLKRMTNSKIDIEYYRKKDAEGPVRVRTSRK